MKGEINEEPTNQEVKQHIEGTHRAVKQQISQDASEDMPC